jgi:hypothetical protein
MDQFGLKLRRVFHLAAGALVVSALGIPAISKARSDVISIGEGSWSGTKQPKLTSESFAFPVPFATAVTLRSPGNRPANVRISVRPLRQF